MEVYKSKKNFKQLRALFPSWDPETSWDIVRNRHLWKLKEEMGDAEEVSLWNDEGEPTAQHLQLIHWAYSPEPRAVADYLAKQTP